MFAAVGNHVVALQRVAIGRLWLPSPDEAQPPSRLPPDATTICLAEGQWQTLTAPRLTALQAVSSGAGAGP